MVKCKIVSDIIVMKIDVDKLGDFKSFEVDTGFHKFLLKPKTEGNKAFGFHTGYNFEFTEDAFILQQQLAKNPIRLTLSNNENILAEGESYWPAYIYKSIDGSARELMHIVKCKLNSTKIKFQVIELIIRLKVTPINSIDIGQEDRISLTNSYRKKTKKPDRKSTSQIFQELAKTYQKTAIFEKDLRCKSPSIRLAKKNDTFRSRIFQEISQSFEKPTLFKEEFRSKIQHRRRIKKPKKYNSLESSSDSSADCMECKHNRLCGGFCAEASDSPESNTSYNVSARKLTNLMEKRAKIMKEISGRDSALDVNRKFCRNSYYRNLNSNYDNYFPKVVETPAEIYGNNSRTDNYEKAAEETEKSHLAKIMTEMQNILYSNQIQKASINENASYYKGDAIKNLQRQLYEDHQRKQKTLDRIYQLMKHPLLQNSMNHIGQKRRQASGNETFGEVPRKRRLY